MNAPSGFGYCAKCESLNERTRDTHLFCTACGEPLICTVCHERPIASGTYLAPEAPAAYLREPCCAECSEGDGPEECFDTTGGSELIEQCRIGYQRFKR